MKKTQELKRSETKKKKMEHAKRVCFLYMDYTQKQKTKIKKRYSKMFLEHASRPIRIQHILFLKKFRKIISIYPNIIKQN